MGRNTAGQEWAPSPARFRIKIVRYLAESYWAWKEESRTPEIARQLGIDESILIAARRVARRLEEARINEGIVGVERGSKARDALLKARMRTESVVQYRLRLPQSVGVDFLSAMELRNTNQRTVMRSLLHWYLTHKYVPETKVRYKGAPVGKCLGYGTWPWTTMVLVPESVWRIAKRKIQWEGGTIVGTYTGLVVRWLEHRLVYDEEINSQHRWRKASYYEQFLDPKERQVFDKAMQEAIQHEYEGFEAADRGLAEGGSPGGDQGSRDEARDLGDDGRRGDVPDPGGTPGRRGRGRPRRAG